MINIKILRQTEAHSYLLHFSVAQMNLNKVLQEERSQPKGHKRVRQKN
jgi:hypothetical protein